MLQTRGGVVCVKRSEHIGSFLKAEAGVRHSAVVFLIIFTLVGQDIEGMETEAKKRRATAMWLAWGIPFLLLAFFIITPEQEAGERQRAAARSQSC